MLLMVGLDQLRWVAMDTTNTTPQTPASEDVPRDAPDVEHVEHVEHVIETAPDVEPESVESQTYRVRIVNALRRIGAVLALLTGADISPLRDDDERGTYAELLRAVESRNETVQTYADTAGEVQGWRASDSEHYAAASDADLERAIVMLDRAIARTSSTMRIGAMPSELECEPDYAAQRGQMYVSTYTRFGCDAARAQYPDTTVCDLLTYWAARAAAYREDVDTVNRTLRAQDRAHSYNLHADVIGEMWDSDALSSNRWHGGDTRRELSLGAADDAAHIGRVALTAPVPTVADLRDDATVRDIIAAIRGMEIAHESDIENMAETLYHEASEGRGSGWCGEYEQTVDRLNGELSSYVGEPFTRRTRCFDVSGSAVIVLRIPVGWSEHVTARDEDDAHRLADSDGTDFAEQLANELNMTYDDARRLLRNHGDVEDIETDGAERCDCCD